MILWPVIAYETNVPNRPIHTAQPTAAMKESTMSRDITLRPRQDSNLRSRLRRPVLYPLSYGNTCQSTIGFFVVSCVRGYPGERQIVARALQT